MSLTPEGQLKAIVASWLGDWERATGAKVFRMNSGVIRKGSRYIHLHPEGTSDYLILIGTMPYWLELKPPGQRTATTRKAKQEAFAKEMMAMGHQYCRASSLDDVIEFLLPR